MQQMRRALQQLRQFRIAFVAGEARGLKAFSAQLADLRFFARGSDNLPALGGEKGRERPR